MVLTVRYNESRLDTWEGSGKAFHLVPTKIGLPFKANLLTSFHFWSCLKS